MSSYTVKNVAGSATTIRAEIHDILSAYRGSQEKINNVKDKAVRDFLRDRNLKRSEVVIEWEAAIYLTITKKLETMMKMKFNFADTDILITDQ